MHEESFINAILEPIENKDNVEALELEIGELVGIEPKHLKKHLSKRVSWNIIIKKKPSKIRCICGYEGPARIRERLHDIVIFDCPKCGLQSPEIIEGKDIKIIKVIYK
ncbi:hypothetical protein GF386_03675 [Candidatus Pacearchaeota archaeon]|nr:hypothetical protein [Candidatus Pacearchaeota archaeon]MBD3283251.1 hypothetical protein [Candidatus Pacearchaeota archaeon]